MNGAPLQQKVVISNPQGFHMRPMAAFAQLASRFESSVKVSREGQSVNGKSILDLMLLAAAQGTELTVEVTGADAEAALDALVGLLKTPPEDDSPEPPVSRN
ncbi:MAG TPA: HPr family phosphocarrier protein [Gemmataceae bacterium]|jgi:phosphotransferase system HPr (HPr) family protein